MAVVFALLSLACGVAAAVFWWLSAAGAPPTDLVATFIKGTDGITPMDRWLAKSAKKSRIATILSGFTALFGATSAVCGVS